MNDIYDDFSDLLGAYALDAVDPDERDRIEIHLIDCPRCRAEVAEHREVAAFLAQSGADAPDGVWDRIASELAPAAPPMRMAILPTGEAVRASEAAEPLAPGPVTGAADVASLDGARARKARSRPMLAVLAVAASIIVVLGVIAVGQTQRANRGQTIEDLASDAAGHSKLTVDLEGADGTAQAVVQANGQGYLILEDMAAPADGDVYQLWGKVDDTVLSLGTFGDKQVVPFSVDASRIGDIELFAITQEKAPGVIESQNEPVMAGAV